MAYKAQLVKKNPEKLTPKQINERFQILKTDRSNWEGHWTELANYILPNRNDIQGQTNPGGKRNVALLDNTAMIANELLAGAMHGMLTNPNAQWFELTTGDTEIDNLDGVRMWLQKLTEKMHTIINNSNFQTEVHAYYLDLTCFGTAAMFIEDDVDSVIRFSTKHIKEIYAAENNRGIIDEVYREFQWNIRQIVAEFGEEALAKSRRLKDLWDKSAPDKVTIIHAVYPKDVTQTSGENRYCSHYVLKDEKEGVELNFGYFREFPAAISRWIKAAGETYGRSSGMNALPSAKCLNKMKETTLIGAQKTVDPPLQAPDDTFVLPIRTRPGGLNFYRSGTTDRLQPVFNDARIDFGFQAMSEEAKQVRQAFYVDQLKLIEGPQQTATEVLQRTEENMRLLGPMLGRQHSEFLRPTIERVFEIMNRRNLIPVDENVVQILQARGIKRLDVTYSSMIAKAQRVQEGQNIQRTMQAIAPFASVDQSVLDNFDADKAVRSIAKIFGFPQEILRDLKDISKMREARATAEQNLMQQQQESHEAEQVGKVAPAIAKLQQAGNDTQRVVNG